VFDNVDDPVGLEMYLHIVSIPAWNPELDEVDAFEKVRPIGPEGLVVVVYVTTVVIVWFSVTEWVPEMEIAGKTAYRRIPQYTVPDRGA